MKCWRCVIFRRLSSAPAARRRTRKGRAGGRHKNGIQPGAARQIRGSGGGHGVAWGGVCENGVLCVENSQFPVPVRTLKAACISGRTAQESRPLKIDQPDFTIGGESRTLENSGKVMDNAGASKGRLADGRFRKFRSRPHAVPAKSSFLTTGTCSGALPACVARPQGSVVPRRFRSRRPARQSPSMFAPAGKTAKPRSPSSAPRPPADLVRKFLTVAASSSAIDRFRGPGGLRLPSRRACGDPVSWFRRQRPAK